MPKTKTVICHDQYGKLYRVSSDKLTFRPSIYGILIKKNKVLLSKKWDGYDFPGGGAELHETIEDTLKREFWEETGLLVKAKKLIYTGTSFYYSIVRKQYWNCLYFYFIVKKIGGELSKENFDEEEKKYAGLAEWVDIKSLGRLKFYNSIDSQISKKLTKQALKII